MRVALYGLAVALLSAPLAAQAARPPVSYAVTLQASVVDRLTYEHTGSEHDCSIRRTGSGAGELRLRSTRPTQIRVSQRAGRIVYRPTRLSSIRLQGSVGGGGFTETKLCRGAPITRLTGDCASRELPARAARLAFRSGGGGIAFRVPTLTQGDLRACGLDRVFPGGGLHLASAQVTERALLNGRARVTARASADRQATLVDDPALTVRLRTTIRWTLSFRRIR